MVNYDMYRIDLRTIRNTHFFFCCFLDNPTQLLSGNTQDGKIDILVLVSSIRAKSISLANCCSNVSIFHILSKDLADLSYHPKRRGTG